MSYVGATSTGDDDYWRLPVPGQGQPPSWQLWPSTSLEASDCGLCHPKQFEEWRTSWHAGAVSPGVLGQLEAFDHDTRQMCLNCHAPRAEQQAALGGSPGSDPVQGVDCAACHLRAHQRFGPRDQPLAPHGPVLAEPLFWSSDFCAPCHQFAPDDIAVNGKLLENTHEEWRASGYAAEGVTCQDCHMPDRSHRFLGIHDPDMLRRGLAVEVERTPGGVVATLSNRGAGHALPTYVTPRIRLLLENLPTTRSAQLVIQRSMHWDRDSGWHELADTRLLPGERRGIQLALARDEAARASVIVEPDADYHDRVYPFLMEQLRGEISDTAMQQLRTAHAAAAASIYTAYRIDCGPAGRDSYRCRP